jgi:hypothetical protein
VKQKGNHNGMTQDKLVEKEGTQERKDTMMNGTTFHQSVIVGSSVAPYSTSLAEMNLSARAEV